MSKLPVKPSGKPSGKELPLTLNDKIARLRQATGQPERCDRPLFCSGSKQQPMFLVGFERLHPGEPFQQTDEGRAAEAAGRGWNATPATASFDQASFAPYSVRCPFCQRGGIVNCEGCKRTYCRGAVTERGERSYFACPTCRNEGVLTSGEAGFQAQALKPNAIGVRVAGLLGGTKTPALEKPKPVLRLPWSRK